MSNHSKIIEALNDLLSRNYDAENGFIEAANQMHTTKEKKWLIDHSNKRQSFINGLSANIIHLGGTPEKGTTFLADLHRFWIDLKGTVSNDEKAIIDECIRGEERALKDYNYVLLNYEFPEKIRQILLQQRDDIQTALVELGLMAELYAVEKS